MYPMDLLRRCFSLVEDVSSHRLVVVSLTGLFVLSLWLIHSYARLRHVPGPFLASLTNFPRVSWILTNRAHDIHISLHRKYGKVVRFGPNMVSVGDPAEISNIYGFNSKFPKSEFYHVLLFYARGKPVPTIFATQDENLHRLLKRPIAGIYSMSNLMSFERYVDSTMRVFFDQLDKRFVSLGKVCDLGVWLQWFAFDVMGEITFSRRLGFLENAEDVGGITESILHYFNKTSPITQMPWLDWLWAKNPLLQRFKSTKANPIVSFAIARANERKQSALQEQADGKSELNNRDFLSRFLEALDKDKQIPPWALTAWTTSNVTAGSDTTAIFLRTLFYNLLTHPATLHRLLAELDSPDRTPLSELVTWKEGHQLPYLDACIKEAGRLHPPFGLPLERVVPPEGALICGKRFAGGTVVGISGWVVHRDKETFGEDCDVWRPERWLDCGEEKRAVMERGLLTFGAGHRSCIGKNISYLEMYKVVPTMLRRYEIELSNEGSWRVENRWFVNQFGLDVRLKLRER